MIYCPDKKVKIRTMEFEDTQTLLEYNYLEYRYVAGYYMNCPKVREQGKKYVFNAEIDGRTAGYITLRLNSDKGPFAWEGIPELEDVHVFREFRHKGIGNMLLAAAEDKASEISNTISVSVGLHSGYGEAQRIYIRRGYIPDGSGVWYEGEPLKPYAKCFNNKNLVIYLSKKLNDN